MQSERIRVAVVGGGIGGLSFALAVAKLIPNFSSYMKIDIYESTASLQAQVGAGIGIWPHTWGIIEALGLDDDMRKLTQDAITDEPCTPFQFRKSNQPQGRDLFTLRTTGGNCIFFHRGHFQAVLLKHLPPSITIHTKKRLSSYTQNENAVQLAFEDGSVIEADMVIGADGLQSRVRRRLFEELTNTSGSTGPDLSSHHPADPLWSGILMYRALVPREKLIESGWGNHRLLTQGVVYAGHKDSIIAFPVNNGAQVNFLLLKGWFHHEGTVFSDEKASSLLEGKDVASVSTAETSLTGDDSPWMENGGGGKVAPGRGKWVARVSQDELRNALAGWEPEVQAMVELIDEPLRWALHTTPQSKSHTSGNVCLIGDAAHAMHPHLGAGAGQAMTDGYVLASLLSAAVSINSSDLKSLIKDTLLVYDKTRGPEGRRVATAAKANAHHFSLSMWDTPKTGTDGVWRDVDTDNKEDLQTLYNRIVGVYTFSWDKYGAMKEADKAVNAFHVQRSMY